MRGFESIHFFDGSPRDTFSDSVKKMNALVDTGLDHWHFDHAGCATLLILRDRSHPRSKPANVASNWISRGIAGSTLRFRIGGLVRDNPGLRLRFATIISDHFNANDRQTVIPLEAIKRDVGQLMAGSGVDGWVGAVEVQACDRSYAQVGRDLLSHVHFLLWTRDPTFDFEMLEQRLASSARLRCECGAPTVVFSGANTDRASPDERLRWARQKAWYMLKMPVHAKNIVHRTDRKARAYGCDVRPVLAVRLLEIMSRLRVDELIMGSGEGRAMAVSVRTRVRAKCAVMESAGLDLDIAAFWTFARRRNGKILYSNVAIERWQNGKRTAPYTRGPYRE